MACGGLSGEPPVGCDLPGGREDSCTREGGTSGAVESTELDRIRELFTSPRLGPRPLKPTSV